MIDKEKVVEILTRLLNDGLVDCQIVFDFIKNDSLTQKDMVQKINELFKNEGIKDVSEVFTLIAYVASGENLYGENKNANISLNGGNFVLDQKPFEFGKPGDYPWNQRIYCSTSTADK